MEGSRRKGLLEEIRQGVPFRSKTQEAFLSLLRTADVAKRRFREVFEGEGITFQQYNVLRMLRGAGEDGLPTLDIGDRMIERQPGVTRIVDRLEKKGWVTRDRCSDDRRRVLCRITAEGLDLLARLDRPVDATDGEIFASLSPGEVERLIGLLERVRVHSLEGSDEEI
jgi:DNA-binding MarR family transcriptional regulator